MKLSVHFSVTSERQGGGGGIEKTSNFLLFPRKNQHIRLPLPTSHPIVHGYTSYLIEQPHVLINWILCTCHVTHHHFMQMCSIHIPQHWTIFHTHSDHLLTPWLSEGSQCCSLCRRHCNCLSPPLEWRTHQSSPPPSCLGSETWS